MQQGSRQALMCFGGNQQQRNLPGYTFENMGEEGEKVPYRKPRNTPSDGTLWRKKEQRVTPKKGGGNVSNGHVRKELPGKEG